jgi:hypothetical protein
VLEANVMQPGDTEISSDGALLHWARQTGHRTLAWLRGLAGQVRHLAAVTLRGLFG